MNPLESITRAVCATHSAATPSLSSSATPPVDGSEGKGARIAEIRWHYRKARDLIASLRSHIDITAMTDNERDNIESALEALDEASMCLQDAEADALEVVR